MKKFVISGGPSSGKSTLISELNKRGFPVIEETAFKLMQGTQNINDWKKFNYDVFQYQLDVESKLSGDVIFLDRGLVDSLVYMKFYQIKWPENAEQIVKDANYERVFFLDILPDKYYFIPKLGRMRRLPIESAKVLHELTKQQYIDFKIPLSSVPFLNIKERADFVLKQI